MMRRLTCLLLVALSACKGEQVHVTDIDLDGPDGGVVSGFDCIETADGELALNKRIDCIASRCAERCRDAGVGAQGECYRGCLKSDATVRAQCKLAERPLMERGAGQPACAVLDLLRVHSSVDCRSSRAQVEWCLRAEQSNCPVLERRVVPLTLPLSVDGGAPSLEETYAAVRAALRGDSLFLSAAPEEWVYVRATLRLAAADGCAGMQAHDEVPDLDGMLGCALSCAVHLSDVDKVTLSLEPGFGTQCTDGAVRLCGAFGSPLLQSAFDAVFTRQ